MTTAAKTTKRRQRPTQTPEERAAQVEALAGELNAAIEGITTDESWISMIRVAACFHQYSLNNVLLLWAQGEHRGISVTQVAGFQKWISLGRHVRKGERGFRIFAPRKHRLTEDEAKAIGPSAYDAQGRPKMVIRGFKIEHVFDVSQTDGEPLPEGPSPTILTGEGPEGLWDAVAALVTSKGYEIRRETSVTPEAFGSVSFTENVVRVRPDIDPAQACKTLIHELAHIEADHKTRRNEITRGQRETEAESVAYIVGQVQGLDTVQYSAPYVAGWSGGDVEVIKKAAEAVHKAAHAILAALDVTEETGDE